MNKFVIITDTSCNLNSKNAALFGVAEILPMHFYMDGKEYDSDGDWKSFSPQDYYNFMRNGAIFKSSQVTFNQYKEAFVKYLEQGYDILSISCTSALSASVKESYRAKEELEPLYPNQKIVCVDSANCIFSLSMVIKEVNEMRNQGASIEEIVAWIDENKLHFNEVGTVEKLTYLRNAGRVSASAAFFGGIFGVKPIVIYDEVGHNVAVEKVKGRRKSLEKCAEYVKKYGIVDNHKTIYIAHADCIEDAKLQAELIQNLFDEKLEFVFDFVEPGVGSSVGPGTIIIDFYGKKEMRELYKK